MKDLQDEPTDIPLIAGVTNLQVLFHSKVKNWKFPVTLKITVPLNKRGAHMSRLVADRVEAGDYVETILDRLALQVYNTCGVTPTIEANFVFPWRDQFANVTITRRRQDPSVVQALEIYGMTACPCSKEMMGIGHMQRCRLKIVLESRSLYEETLAVMERCFSNTLQEKLKRNDEARVIKYAQENCKFVEDVAREAIKLFGNELIEVEVETEESIHAHNAYAFWRRDI